MGQYPQHMKISELSKYSKIPVTTIRFYIQEGMLPPPLKTAKTMAYYNQAHLDRLLQIQKMKEKNLSTAIIKEILAANGDVPSVTEEGEKVLMTSTRKEILKVAVNLFREKGYDRVTIADIAAVAKISKRTFYQYFRNKEELFGECLEDIFYDIGKDIPELQIETDGLKRLRLRERHFGRYSVNILEMLNLAQYEAFMNSDQFKGKLNHAISNFVEPIRKDMELIIQQKQSPLVNSNVVANLFMGALEFAYYYYLNNNADPESISETFWRFFFADVPSQITKENGQ